MPISMDQYIEDTLECPITHQIFVDPVFAEDGHVYEREAIWQWLEKKKESPFTRKPMKKDLRPAHIIKGLVAKYLEENPDQKKHQFKEFQVYGKNKKEIIELIEQEEFLALLYYTDFVLTDKWKQDSVFIEHLLNVCNDEQVIMHIFKKAVDVDCLDMRKWRPFHYILKLCSYSLTKKLFEKYKCKWTLYESEYSDSIDARYCKPNLYEIIINSFHGEDTVYNIVKYLIELGIDINTYNDSYGGHLPIHFAIKKKYTKAVKLLIKSNADLNLTTAWNIDTTVTFACRYGNLEIIKALFDAGGSLTQPNIKYDTPLMTICKYQDIDTIKYFVNYFIERKVKIESYHTCCGDLCYTPFGALSTRDFSSENKDFVREMYLSELDMGQDSPHCIGRYLMRKWNEDDMVKFFIDHLKINVNSDKGTYNGWYFIHYILRYYNYDILKHYLEKYDNVDLNCRNRNGETPLMFAVRYQSINEVVYLLEKKFNVNPNAFNKLGENAWMIAKKLSDVDPYVTEMLAKVTTEWI